MDLQRIYVKPQGLEGQYSYDEIDHRWILAPEYIQKIQPKLSFTKASRKARSYSSHVYNLMYDKYVSTYNRNFVEWLISCTEEGKRFMLGCLREQAEADAQSNIDDIAYQSPLSERGKDYSPEELALACVASNVHRMIYNGCIYGLYINKCFDFGVRLGGFERYERWGY